MTHHTQQQAFKKQIANILASYLIPNTYHQYVNFVFCLDRSGALHYERRIHNAPILEFTKFPNLLPTKHHFIRLVIYTIYNAQLHA